MSGAILTILSPTTRTDVLALNRSDRPSNTFTFLNSVALACAVCWQGAYVLNQRYHLGIHRVTGVIGDPITVSPVQAPTQQRLQVGLSDGFGCDRKPL